MTEPKLINVYGLQTVNNICNQVLREVISLPNISMAHVTMNPGNVSLLHQHSIMSEIYFILDGEGILYYGDNALEVKKAAYLVLPPKTPHKLRNMGNFTLEHIVLAIPPFIPSDIKLLEGNQSQIKPISQKFKYNKNPLTALDGATIYELMTDEERKKLDITLAIGFLPEGRKAISHYHKISDELYYIISGYGKVAVDDYKFNVRRGSLVLVPKNCIHALENGSNFNKLDVLCISSPAYTNGDFILK